MATSGNPKLERRNNGRKFYDGGKWRARRESNGHANWLEYMHLLYIKLLEPHKQPHTRFNTPGSWECSLRQSILSKSLNRFLRASN